MIRYSRRVPESFAPNRIHQWLEARRAAGAGILDLTESNPTRVGLPVPPVEAWRDFETAARRAYDPSPLGEEPARRAVSAYYADRGYSVAAERVALTASTSEAYAHLFRLLADPEDEFLVPEPSYPLLGPLADLEGARLAAYPLRYREGRWRIDLESLSKAIGPRARAIVVVHPNNPTGSFLDRRESESLEAICAERGLALVADEVFGDFVLGPPPSRPSFVDARRAATFVLSGLSKICGLPQAKLAWIALAGPDDEIARSRERLEWIGDSFLSVAAAAQGAAPALLASRHAFQDAVRARVAGNLAALDSALAEVAGVQRLAVEGGWSAVLRLPASRSEEDCVRALLERDVLVHPGHFFDFPDEPYLVLSLLPEPESFQEGARRIANEFGG